MNADLAHASLVDLGGALRRGETTSEALTLDCLERLETRGRELRAVVTVMRDLALRQAQQADAELRAGRPRGPLHGIPYGVKDVVAARGAPTTWGAAPYRDQTFDEDAAVVGRLREAGAVLVAKLATLELAGALGYTTSADCLTGATLNPWDSRYWSGGSSSGSAAAVAAGLVGFAIGSESWGSMLGPAAACGVSALRPTYGLVPTRGSMTYAWSLDKLGPMARSAEDCALVLSALTAGTQPALEARDSTPFGGPGARRWRVGVPRGIAGGTQPAVAKAFEASLAQLGEIADVDEVDLPAYPWIPVIASIVDSEAGVAFRDLIESGRTRQLASPGARLGGYAALVTPASVYLDAQRVRRRLAHDLAILLEGYDAIVGPTQPGVADPLEPFAEAEMAALEAAGAGASAPPSEPPDLIIAGNLAGLPGLAIPNGLGWRGLPTSLQIVGRPFGEADVVRLGAQLQDGTGWHRRRPA